MSFTRPTFFLIFLPIAVLINFIIPGRLKKIWITIICIAGLFLTQPYYLVFYIILVGINYFFAFLNSRAAKNDQGLNWPLMFVIVINISLLVIFKKISSSSAYPQNPFLFNFKNPEIQNFHWIFPLGLSYTIFQLVSYQIDISSEASEVERDPFKFINYSLFYPKMFSGPIQRYDGFKSSLENPTVNLEKINQGLQRFILGLAKKVLIADVLVRYINPVFDLKDITIPTLHAWFILLLLAIQIYYDFSGVIDMAIGIAQMLGYKLAENFNYPYISRSVTEFWRRWHISLGAWFRDYFFIPMQFRLRKIKAFPLQLITVLVFLLTGLWHGFNNHFIVWGLMFGLVIAFENSKLGAKLKEIWLPLQHLWTLGWVVFSWLIFRAPGLKFVMQYVTNLVGLQGEISQIPFSQTNPYPIFETSVFIAAFIGILFSLPVYPWLKNRIDKRMSQSKKWYWTIKIAGSLLLILLFVFCIGMIVYSGPLPGVYDKF